MNDTSTTLIIPRMFSDAAGECRFDQTAVPLRIKEYAPPAAPVAVSDTMQTGRCVFMRIPPGWIGDQHPTPQKQLIVCLSGAVRFSNGDTVHELHAGESLIDANTAGPGHATEVISEVPFEGWLITLT